MANITFQVDLTNTTDQSKQLYPGEVNEFNLNVTNNNNSSYTLTSGNATDPGDATTITLYFNNLFTSASEAAAMTISSEGWSSAWDASENAWVLCPDTNLVINKQESFIINAGNCIPTIENYASYNLEADFFNIKNNSFGAYQYTVILAAPPQASLADLNEAMTFTFYCNGDTNNRTITLSKSPEELILNTLTLVFGNKSSQNPVVPPASQVPGQTPRFIVTFTAVDGTSIASGNTIIEQNALTTSSVINSIGTLAYSSITNKSASTLWNITKDTNSNPTSFVITPAAGNTQLLGVGQLAYFDFSQITSQLLPTPTMMYIQFTGVPGYNDSYTALLLYKGYASVVIDHFETLQNNIVINNNITNTVGLSWQVNNATLVELSGAGQVPFNSPYNSGGSNINYTVPVETSETLVLTAYDMATGKIASSTAEFTTNPTISAQLLPIGTIAVWSGSLNDADFPQGWAVCDGTNNTPNLVNYFVPGAGSSFPLNNHDADPQHTHPVPDITVTGGTLSSEGIHNHGMPGAWSRQNMNDGGDWGSGSRHTCIDIDGNNDPSDSKMQNNTSTHTHTYTNTPYTVSGLVTGSNSTVFKPNWYALLYIMKISG